MTQDQTGTRTFASRHGLVRPTQGRFVAGVCAALARATKTDPVLWRVTLAVLICFAGVGAALYLLIWLVSPEEGDTASPLESLFGRGRSSTSPVITVVLSLITAGLLIFILQGPLYVVLGGAVVLAILLLINRSPAAEPAAPSPYPGEPPPAPPAGPSTVPQPPAASPVTSPVTSPVSSPISSPIPSPISSPIPEPGPEPGPIGPLAPPAPTWTPPPPPTPPAGYRPPFAPHGPFAGPPLPPPPPPPRRPRERSALPPLIFFAGLLALAVVGAADLAGLNVPVAGYIAAALAVVGAGLVVGAWLGRARPLIALGIVLALLLPTVHTVEVWDRPEYVGDEFTWRPDSVADMQDEYTLMLGGGELDLTGVDFSGQDVSVAVDVSFGEIRVHLPAEVAVEADVNCRFGSTVMFGADNESCTQETIRNPGSGDPTDGTLRLDLRNRFGSLQVDRMAVTR